MTVNEAVARALENSGADVSRHQLCAWLGEIENTVVQEIAKVHEGMPYDETVITADTDGERVLFAPDPYSALYINYLLMKTDLYLRDTAQYVTSSHVFSVSYGDFADWYNRAYMPYEGAEIRL